MTTSLSEQVQLNQYVGYSYAYPHKTSYRKLEPAVPLSTAWQHESTESLFLYVHIPFCEMRCGFCNLFTTVQPKDDLINNTLNATLSQSRIVAEEIQPQAVRHLAFGGGTPSYLEAKDLEFLLSRLESDWPLDWNNVNASFEISPMTVSDEKLALLKSRKFERISMGVQSFSASDLKQLGRTQSNHDVLAAIEKVRQFEFPILNLDLIYGVEGQTEYSWMESIHQTIEIAPSEIYLYPLYVRELTGLGRTGKSPNDQRYKLYLLARDELRAAGYEQVSMRMFRHKKVESSSNYCCQDDGMIGLGPGARSYTQALHYSTEYAVGSKGVKSIIADFNSRQDQDYAFADYGVWLDDEEQRRRYLIKSLLRKEGLRIRDYVNRFGSEVEDDFLQLEELLELELAVRSQELLRLTDSGLSLTDVIGPWLYSPKVAMKMQEFELV